MQKSRRIRILYVSHRSDMTGACKCLSVLAQNVDRKRFDAEIVLPEVGLLQEVLGRTNTIHLLDRKQFGHIGFATVRRLSFVQLFHFFWVELVYTWKLYFLARRFDIVHVNTVEEPLAAVAAKLARVPVVWHIHESFQDTFVFRTYAKFVRAMSKKVVFVSKNSRNSFLRLLRGDSRHFRSHL